MKPFTNKYKFTNKVLIEAYERLINEPIKLSTIEWMLLIQERINNKKEIFHINEKEHEEFTQFINDYFTYLFTNLLKKEKEHELH